MSLCFISNASLVCTKWEVRVPSKQTWGQTVSTGHLLAVSLGAAAVGSRSGLGSSWTVVSPKGNSRPMANCARLASRLSLQVAVTESILAPLSSHLASHSKLLRLLTPTEPCHSGHVLSRSAFSWSPAFLFAPVSYPPDLASECEECFCQLWEGLPAPLEYS